MQTLDVADIRSALSEIAAHMQRRRTRGRLYLAGGAAMMLAYDADRMTVDVDAAIEAGYDALIEAVTAIARRRGWTRSWLNEQATPYMPSPEHRHGTVVFDHPGLTVVAASAEHMLAMKARAARRSDLSDFRRLVDITGINTPQDISAIVAATFDGERLGKRQIDWITSALTDIAIDTPDRGIEL